jgi:DNA-binding CsgD family transcriptional regulator/tetratricopeptide (TPR) repeat protein
MIVGRAGEVDTFDGYLADPLADPRALLIDGEPGIGKTALLHELLARARVRGYAVLSCRPARSEMDLSYAGLVELLDGVPGPVLDGLPAPQARVLRMVLRREEPDGTLDRLSLGVATVAAVRALAPVLLAVDDAQWLDHPTARTLAFVVRRLAGTRVRVALVRSLGGFAPDHEASVDWRTELERAMAAGRLDAVTVGPIGPSDLSRILRRALGWVPAWPRLTRIAQLSGGNPLYALELSRAFGAARSGEDLDGYLPGSLGELARTRVAKLPDRVRGALELASVPRAPTLDLLRRLDSTAADPRDTLAGAVRSGIVILDGDRVRFTHPVLAAAAYGSMPTGRRHDLHRAVAMLSDNLEERARHLATAANQPDSEVASTLQEAAEQAWRRGAPDAAADLLRLACRLTPPTDTRALALRRIAYGRLLHGAGDAPGALAELDAIVAGLPPGLLRARALFHLMYVTRLSGALGRAVEHGVRAAREAADDPALQAEVYEMLSRLSDDDVGRKLDAARRGLDAVDRIPQPDPDLVFHARAALVEAEFYAGLGVHLDRLDGVDPGTRVRFPPVRTAWRGVDLIGRLLAYAGRVDEGLAALRGMYDRAAVEGRSILPAVLGWMAEAQLMAGRFAQAEELTREALARADETGGTGTPWEIGFHGVALARLGRLDEAESEALRVVALAGADPAIGLDEAPARLALGIVALARDRYPDAVAHLRYLDGLKRAAGIREPRLCAHAAELVEALVGTGELVEAAEVLARFDEEAATSRGEWSLAAAARCQALLLGAEGDLDGACEAARRSLVLFEGLPMPFERARSVLALGQLHRRRREKRLARTALAEALATFDAVGAVGWADRTRAELARIPARRTATDHTGTGLTPTEVTIAGLAARGLTNREIADRTFLSPKTVEVNLTRIYRKLGVRSRAALAGRYRDQT